MPCYDSRDDNDADIERKARLATRAACVLAGILRNKFPSTWKGMVHGETLKWIAAHDKEDAARLQLEQKEAQETRARKTALAKLTPEERKLLRLERELGR